jgi:hypothetical protein
MPRMERSLPRIARDVNNRLECPHLPRSDFLERQGCITVTKQTSPQLQEQRNGAALRWTSVNRGRVWVARFWYKNVWTYAVILLSIHAGLLAYSATTHSPTLDEPGHLVAGLNIWSHGRYELYRTNPPLAKLIAALPVVSAGYQADWSSFYESPGARPVFRMGSDFVKANGERSILLFTIARWACIPISLTGGLFCFLWSRELWNSSLAGLISLTLWCFEPNILAHGELITPDCAGASLGLGAGYMFWRWLKVPTWSRAIAAGTLLGLAELAKMTWVILFGMWPLLWLFWLITHRRDAGRGNALVTCREISAGDDSDAIEVHETAYHLQAGQLVLIVLFGLYILNLGYAFDDSFTRLKEFTFVSSTLTGHEDSAEPGNRFADSLFGEVPMPVPKQYLLGMDIQKHDFEDNGRPSYLRGQWKDGGWWYYYLYALAVKTPHGTQLLLLVAVFSLVLRSHRTATWHDLVILLAPAATVLILVSSQLKFNHHVRYVLPVFGFTFIFCGVTSHWFRISRCSQLRRGMQDAKNALPQVGSSCRHFRRGHNAEGSIVLRPRCPAVANSTRGPSDAGIAFP